MESGGRKGSGPARRGAVGGRKELPGACRSQQQQEQWYSSKCPLLLLEKSSSCSSGVCPDDSARVDSYQVDTLGNAQTACTAAMPMKSLTLQ